MIFVVNAENRDQFAADLSAMHRQRKTVFVDRARWDIPVVGDLEIDRYDRDDTVYLIAKDNPRGPVLASLRLLQTQGAHLMRELFTSRYVEAIPHGPTVWEASRFCVAPTPHTRNRAHALVWEAVCAVIETSLLYGMEQVVFAVNRALLRLVLNCGWEARVIDPLRGERDDGVTAAAAVITLEGLRAVRRLHGIVAPTTRMHAEAVGVGSQP